MVVLGGGGKQSIHMALVLQFQFTQHAAAPSFISSMILITAPSVKQLFKSYSWKEMQRLLDPPSEVEIVLAFRGGLQGQYLRIESDAPKAGGAMQVQSSVQSVIGLHMCHKMSHPFR